MVWYYDPNVFKLTNHPSLSYSCHLPRWSDSSPLDFQAWNVNEPNDANGEEECAEFYQGKPNQINSNCIKFFLG